MSRLSLLQDKVVIFAIEVENVIDFGEEMTTAVSAAIPGAVTAVLAEWGNWVNCETNS